MTDHAVLMLDLAQVILDTGRYDYIGESTLGGAKVESYRQKENPTLMVLVYICNDYSSYVVGPPYIGVDAHDPGLYSNLFRCLESHGFSETVWNKEYDNNKVAGATFYFRSPTTAVAVEYRDVKAIMDWYKEAKKSEVYITRMT